MFSKRAKTVMQKFCIKRPTHLQGLPQTSLDGKEKNSTKFSRTIGEARETCANTSAMVVVRTRVLSVFSCMMNDLKHIKQKLHEKSCQCFRKHNEKKIR